jgi:predicted RNA binding protein YcfA (HicA-like mRNA interferase family)
MKRRDLVGKIEEGGAIFIRHGGKHDWFQNPQTKISQPVPRHSEINDMLARSIIKKLAAQERG